MWSAFVFASITSLLQPNEPIPPKPRKIPQSACSHPIAQQIGSQYPEAQILSEEDFAGAVVVHSFLYRDVDNDVVFTRPGKFFGEAGRYSFGHRPLQRGGGTYTFECGRVSISTTVDQSFLGLGKDRVFFRDRGRLLTTGIGLRASVFEMIPNP